MKFDLSAATVAQYDQRVASMSDILDAGIRDYASLVGEHGETVATLMMSGVLAVLDDPALYLDLLTVAIGRLANL